MFCRYTEFPYFGSSFSCPFSILLVDIMSLLILYLRYLFLNFKFKFFTLQEESYITLRDLKGGKLSGSVFNILFNLNKFMAFETRDPFLIRQVHEYLIKVLLCC